MAFIPKGIRAKRDETISYELIFGVIGAGLVAERYLSDNVHSSLSFVLLPLIFIVIGYAILPNGINKGHVGYERLIYYCKYVVIKQKRKGLR